MLFNSYIFILVFLPITWLAFFLVARYRKVDVSVGVLVVASLIFYSYWNPKFVLLILFSIGFTVDSSRAADSSKITVAYSSNILGYLEPCG